MNTFIINKNNILYKNYIIRIKTQCKTINICSYENFIRDVRANLKLQWFAGISEGNWIDGIWLNSGISHGNYPEKFIKKSEAIEKCKELIDKISAYDNYSFDDLWFFVCLSYLTRANINLNNLQKRFSSMNFDRFDISIIKHMLDLNKISLNDTLKQAVDKEYGTLNESGDEFLINKKNLLIPFLNKLISLENSFDKYEENLIAIKNQELYPLIEKDFVCFKNKIIYKKQYLTHIDDVEKDLKEQLLKNVKLQDIDDTPDVDLTGQLSSFYLNHVLKTGNIYEIEHEDLPGDIYRELIRKDYIDISVSYKDNGCWHTFNDKLINEIKQISSTVPDVRKHSAAQYIKNIAKQLKKKDKTSSLMNLQKQLVQQHFKVNDLKDLYYKIKEDIVLSLSKNKEYIYSEIKKEDFICFGKNHIGYYAHKPLNKILYHMAFIENEKLIDSIRQHYKVIELDKYQNFVPDNTITFIVVKSSMINNHNIEFIKQIIMQGRSYNKFLLFNFSSILDAQDFLAEQLILANTYQVSYSKEIYEAVK